MKEQVMDKYIIYDEETQTYSMDPEQAVRDDVEKHHWINTIKTIIKDWRLYLMLVPMLFVFFCWRYLPMYELLGAFKYSNSSLDVADQQYVGFYYFARLINGDVSPDFWAAFRNTFLLSFYGMCFGFPMPIIVALFFNEIKSNILRSTFQVMTYLPKFMSTVVMTTLTIMLLKQSDLVSEMGVVSNFMVQLGLISEDVGASGLLNGPQYFRAIYQITGIWEGAGYDSIVYFAAIIAISPTSYEAAQIDGAARLRRNHSVAERIRLRRSVGNAGNKSGMRPSGSCMITHDPVCCAGRRAVYDHQRFRTLHHAGVIVIQQVAGVIPSAWQITRIQAVCAVARLIDDHAGKERFLPSDRCKIFRLIPCKVIAAVHGIGAPSQTVQRAHDQPDAVAGAVRACTALLIGRAALGDFINLPHKCFRFHISHPFPRSFQPCVHPHGSEFPPATGWAHR